MDISEDERIWLAFLATRRDTFILPAANCIGYIKDKRYSTLFISFYFSFYFLFYFIFDFY